MGDLTLCENQVDIWRIHIGVQKGGTPQCRGLLSSEEVQRADRFYLEKHRCRFAKAHATVRQILSRYTGLPPQELVFSYGAAGKPELSGALERSGIKFNLSHSDEIGLVAVTQGLAVGIDIELVNSELATDEIAEHFFSAREVRHLRALPPAGRVDAFFACWTRKEAYIKALGEGLSVPLDSFEVAFGRGIAAALLQVRTDPCELTRWSMYDVDVGKMYRAALVVEGREHRLNHLRSE